ncbi:MAG: CZB domain-containing protein [Lachnospiraceae bacterium]|nr:CZB domain-containing protein [Lachnospiraceae bacterium]
MLGIKSKNITETVTDRDLLLSLMEKAAGGDYSYADESTFKDRELAKKYNELLKSIVVSNNKMVMKLNNAMVTIGDSSCVKTMIEQVDSQNVSIDDIRAASKELGDSIMDIQDSVMKIKDNAHAVTEMSQASIEQMTESVELVDKSTERVEEISDRTELFRDQANKINEIVDMVKKIANKTGLLALNASIEAARAGEAGRGFSIVAGQMKDLSAETTTSVEKIEDYVSELIDGVDSITESIAKTSEQLAAGNERVHKSIERISEMDGQIDAISASVDHIYDEINTQTALTENVVASIDSIGESYDELAEECMATGKHLYTISRAVDKLRSDLARGGAKLNTLDWLVVFEIDHLIFTWRVFNNLAGYEKLKLEQLNNPSGCKFGKWLGKQTDSRITSSPAFKNAAKVHEELHRYATESWKANEDGNRKLALEKFNKAYETFTDLREMFVSLRKAIIVTGDTAVTDIG